MGGEWLQVFTMASFMITFANWVGVSVLSIALWPTLDVIAQSMPVQVGMSYSVAKDLLIKAGWRPLGHGDILCDDNCFTHKLRNEHVGATYKMGLQETLACLPTQPVSCEQLFFNSNGRGIILETQNRNGSAYAMYIGSSYVYRRSQ